MGSEGGSDRRGVTRRRTLTGVGAGVAAGLAGCVGGLSGVDDSGGSGGSNGSGGSGESSGSVTMWNAYFDDPEYQPTLDWVRNQLNQQDITLQAESFSYDDMNQKFLTGGRSGTPDALNGELEQYSEYARAGLIEPIGDRAEQLPYYDRYVDSMMEALTYDGELWGLPVIGGGRVLFYRKDILEKYGQDPPETASELKRIAEMITKNEQGMNGFHITTQKGEIRVFQEYVSHLLQMSPDIYTQSNGNWSLEPSAETLGQVFKSYYADLFAEQGPSAISPDVRGAGWESNDIGYLQGNQAMIECGNWLLGLVTDAPSEATANDVLDNTGAVLLPHIEGAENPDGTYLAVNSLLMNSASENKDAAWETMSTISSPEGVKRAGEGAIKFNTPPPIEGIESGIDNPDLEALNESGETGVPLAYVNWGPVAQALYSEVQQVVYNRKSAMQAGEDLHGKWSDLTSEFEN